MQNPLRIDKYSVGMGDRFARQAKSQLRASHRALEHGVRVVPVWNKSNREHLTIGSEPGSTRAAADAAVKALDWRLPYHVDADHIGLATVDRFLPHADFYTIDVADWIGRPAPVEISKHFATRHGELAETISIPGVAKPFALTTASFEKIAGKYLLSAQEAGKIYRHIAQAKGEGRFITEVSMDETDLPQTPPELLVILVALADEGIPLQTIAPKFTGRFNKGVDYAGDLRQFEKEFSDDLAVIAYAVHEYRLPETLKLSVHSGSDKFSLYGPMRRALAKSGAGLHLKTAGTTWLEELIGLAEAGGDGLSMAKEIYAGALEHMDELCAPYTTVIDIDRQRLPSAAEVQSWSAEQYVSSLRHDPANRQYNPHLRQLLHVGYKIAARLGARYLEALERHEECVARNVTENLYERHLKPLFVPAGPGPDVEAAKSAQTLLGT